MEKNEYQQFLNDGFIILKNFLEPEVVGSVQRGCEKLVDDLGEVLKKKGLLKNMHREASFQNRLEYIAKELPFDDTIPNMFRKELHLEEFFPLFCHKKIIDVVCQCLPEAEKIRIFPNYSIRPKLPNNPAMDIVWHQDVGLNADGTPQTTPVEERLDAFGPGRVVNCWTPLVQATKETGCMLVVPGSHKLGIQPHVQTHRYREERADDEGPTYGVYSTQIHPDVMTLHEQNAIYLECEPGDMVFFSHLLIHRGGFNISDIVRWSVDWRYQDASKPTLRQELGHLVWSKGHQNGVIKTEKDWINLKLE